MPEYREIIDNFRSERIRRVADLADRRQRQRHGRFLVEGPQSVREAVLCRPRALTDLYIEATDGDLSAVSPVVARIRKQAQSQAPEVYIHYVSARVMRVISKDAQGIAAVGRLDAMAVDADSALAPAQADGSAPGLVAALWQVRDPGNAGTIIRAADAAGCRALVLVDECVDPYNPKVLRSTAGSIFHIPVVRLSTDDFFGHCDSLGLDVLAADVYGTTDLRPESLPDYLARTRDCGMRPTAVLFGNEARGLPESVLARTRDIVSIPIYGQAESLNLATSASVMLYALAMSSRLGRM
ncbi:TrmH family RNA methyltransferase [Bifidobacterium xylocopae]|uniref:rRNA methyltransferase n=1 Tax=Bifidobacterium xylocopae TaxID=2493119 RepID=A0A366KFD9_9BIFI|nr:RNA methyltransferase [Bifidobacterium xylocopae]RBP99972.1 rRNA methyltransferase [Bifidobacterium xylocopae]